MNDPSLRDSIVGRGVDNALHIAKEPIITGFRDANGVGTSGGTFELLDEELFITHS